jgi:hypothetical protein
MEALQMKINPKVTLDRIVEAVQRQQTTLDNPGFCIACSEEAEGIDPDGRKCKCEFCGEAAVYGAEELLLMLA